jgi:hypothetical protein
VTKATATEPLQKSMEAEGNNKSRIFNFLLSKMKVRRWDFGFSNEMNREAREGPRVNYDRRELKELFLLNSHQRLIGCPFTFLFIYPIRTIFNKMDMDKFFFPLIYLI